MLKACHMILRLREVVATLLKIDEQDLLIGSTLENLLLSCQPEVPAPGKWTKLGSSLAFLLVGFNICNCLETTYKASIATIHLEKNNAADESLDPALTHELHWSAVTGKRAKSGLLLTGNGTVQFHALLLAIVQEVTRFLTCWHLKAGHRQNRKSVKPPALLDAVNPKFSPYVMVLQYLSSLLVGAGRVLLICPGFSSIDEWVRTKPEEVRALRRICMHASGWIYRRHLSFAEEPPVSTCVTCL